MGVLALVAFVIHIRYNPDPNLCAQAAAVVAPPTPSDITITYINSPRPSSFATAASKGTQDLSTTSQSLYSSTVRALSAATSPVTKATAARRQAYAHRDPIPNSTGPASELLPLAEALLAIPNSSIPTSAAAEASAAAAVEEPCEVPLAVEGPRLPEAHPSLPADPQQLHKAQETQKTPSHALLYYKLAYMTSGRDDLYRQMSAEVLTYKAAQAVRAALAQALAETAVLCDHTPSHLAASTPDVQSLVEQILSGVAAALAPPPQQYSSELPAAATAAEAPTAAPINTTCTIHEAPAVPAAAAVATAPGPEAASARAPAQQCPTFQPLVECPTSAAPAVTGPRAAACPCDNSESSAVHQLWVKVNASKLLRLEDSLSTIVADAAAWVQDATAYVRVSYRAECCLFSWFQCAGNESEVNSMCA
jgi:hypothetical protein